jgi:hypothetical protein
MLRFGMSSSGVWVFALALLAVSGCGASSTDDRDAAAADAVTEADVRSLGDPRKLADVPANGDALTLHLYVSNQSFDISPVDIDIWVEDTHVVTGGFDVEGQHNWILFDLTLPSGTHALHAEGLGGSIVINEAVPVPEERWGVLDFWYYPGDPTHPMFTWNLSETPVGFQ